MLHIYLPAYNPRNKDILYNNTLITPTNNK